MPTTSGYLGAVPIVIALRAFMVRSRCQGQVGGVEGMCFLLSVLILVRKWLHPSPNTFLSWGSKVLLEIRTATTNFSLPILDNVVHGYRGLNDNVIGKILELWRVHIENLE